MTGSGAPEPRRDGGGRREQEAPVREGRAGGGPLPAVGICELCGGPTIERHCKIVCRNCGYQRDCSDP